MSLVGRVTCHPDADEIMLGDNLQLLPRFADGSFQLIYIDPPFNTGRAQARRTLGTVSDPDGDRTGFNGRRYATRLLAESSYRDSFEDYLAFLHPRLLLAREGTLYFHIDYRESHYCRLLLDEIFGRECFLNELVWHMTTAGAHAGAGRPSTTRSSSTSPIPPPTTSTRQRSTASHIWRPAW